MESTAERRSRFTKDLRWIVPLWLAMAIGWAIAVLVVFGVLTSAID